MDLTLIAVHFADISWILIALVFGLLVSFISLPPMVGYLVAGFVLSAIGLQSGDALAAVADIGVTLLLFSIGLKLNIKDLLRPEIWAVSVVHLVITVVIFGLLIFVLSFSSLQYFVGLTALDAMLIAFALSFSSTVFAVKMLDEKAEMHSLHGKIAIGILIMQDLFAVVFITITSGKIPSYTAVFLLLLIPLRPALFAILRKAGHGELLILCGMTFALGGASLFDWVGIKADLGALLLGVLLAGNEKSEELAKSLLAFKEIFLVAFFLSIGFNGTPTLSAIAIALALVVFMFAKSLLFYKLLTAFKLRARTGFLASLTLSNYSEFGLIVGSVGVSAGLMDKEWLVIIAIALSITFVIASFVDNHSHRYYARYEDALTLMERRERLPYDRPIDVGDAEVLVFGMGRVGSGVYDSMVGEYKGRLLGIDIDSEVIEKHRLAGRNVMIGDATDYDFWERLEPGVVKMIMLDMPNIQELLSAVEMMKQSGYECHISAAVKNDDCIQALLDAGVHAVYNVYAEAGSGFAHHVCESIKNCPIDTATDRAI
jgi:predicted Kef-type K+ transport protein